MKVLVISSADQLINIIRAKPDLLNIITLQPLRSYLTGKRNCCKNQVKPLSLEDRKNVESLLNNLTTADYELMKKLLGMDELRYYVSINGKITQVRI
jgi:ABC-type methionine transport system permease subunit